MDNINWREISEQWRRSYLLWQSWATALSSHLGLQPDCGHLGDAPMRDLIGRLAMLAVREIGDNRIIQAVRRACWKNG